MKPDWPEWTSPCGRVRLINADCLDVLPTLGKVVTCTVTSPPYNQLEGIDADNLTGLWGVRGATGKAKGQFVNNGYFDGLPEHEYQQEQNDIFGMLYSRTADGGSLFYNHQIRWRDGTLIHPIEWFRPMGWRLRQEIVWDRCGGMMFNARMFCRFDERILWFVRGSNRWNQESVGYGTVWRIAREQNKQHPVAFPLDLPFRAIEATTDEDDLVCDPYAGSCTTGVAAIQLNRRFIGIEKSPEFFELARDRIAEALGMEVARNGIVQKRMFTPTESNA